MINEDEAKIIALNEINSLAPKNYTVVIAKTITFDDGWLFFYQSEEGLKTGNVLDRLLGNVPFIVDKLDGKIYYLDIWIDEYNNLENPGFCSDMLMRLREQKVEGK